jgi:DNA-binding transcriptional LysR family regulator
MVAEGMGVALLPGLAVGSAGVQPGVVLRATGNRDHRTINLVGAAGADVVPAIAATVEAIAGLAVEEWRLASVG